MSPLPAQPKIYHITHVNNLAAIVADGAILSDATIIARGGPIQAIGMTTIKHRRVTRLVVDPHPGTRVGDYVPFYFCPRSIMLYVIHRANHPELTYRGGQGPIVHLEADLNRVITWANANGRRWAFSLSNAGANYAEFGSRVEELDRLDWNAIAATDFRAAEVKERKQSEFLVHDSFPFDLVERIGVCASLIQTHAIAAVASAAHRPAIEIHPEWYF